MKSCLLYQTIELCESQRECKWRNVTGTCETVNATWNCSLPCAASGQCRWIGGRCAAPCESYTNGLECPWPTCEWTGSSCRSSCVTLDEVSCRLDPTCTISGGLCRVACAYGSQSLCTRDGSCAWSAIRGKCVKACVFMTTTEGCVAQGGCMWNTITGTCLPAPVASSCNASSPNLCVGSCTWLPSGCAPSCDAIYNVTESCNADRRCQWAGGVCRTRCASLTLETCGMDMSCEWTGQSCDAVCSFGNSARCMDANCSWNARAAVCRKACSALGGAARCASRNDCTWNATSAFCSSVPAPSTCDAPTAPLCFAAGCRWVNESCSARCDVSYTSSAACGTDSSCTWNGGACRPACRQYTSSACSLDLHCVVTANGCTNACSFATALTCNLLTACAWSASRGMCIASCLTTSDAGVCFGRSECSWNAPSGTCQSRMAVDNCTSLEMLDRCLAAGCRWLATGCATPCSVLYSDASSCRRDATCMWANGRCASQCAASGRYTELSCRTDKTCDIIGDVCAATCRGATREVCVSDPVCVWTGTLCAKACVRSSVLIDGCIARAECAWNPTTNVCSDRTAVNTCSFFTAMQCAGNASDCRTIAGSCTPRCVALYSSNKELCTNDRTCTYVSGSCRTHCGLLLSQSHCNPDLGCLWDGQMCKMTCTYGIGASCESDYECVYNNRIPGGICEKSCVHSRNTNECSGRPVCTWNAATGSCLSSLAVSECVGLSTTVQCLVSSCRWVGSACTSRCSDLYSNSTTCALDSSCSYQGGKCRSNCRALSLNECIADLSCAINGSTCVDVCAHVTQDSCQADASCLWSSAKNECVKGCHLTDASLCDTRSECTQVSGACAAAAARPVRFPGSESCTGIGCAWVIALITLGALLAALLLALLLWRCWKRCFAGSSAEVKTSNVDSAPAVEGGDGRREGLAAMKRLDIQSQQHEGQSHEEQNAQFGGQPGGLPALFSPPTPLRLASSSCGSPHSDSASRVNRWVAPHTVADIEEVAHVHEVAYAQEVTDVRVVDKAAIRSFRRTNPNPVRSPPTGSTTSSPISLLNVQEAAGSSGESDPITPIQAVPIDGNNVD